MKNTREQVENQRAKCVAQMEREYQVAKETGKKRMGLSADQIRILIDNFAKGIPSTHI